MTYFISGHRDLTWEEFAKWYAPAISRTLSTDNAAKFVVGVIVICRKCLTLLELKNLYMT